MHRFYRDIQNIVVNDWGPAKYKIVFAYKYKIISRGATPYFYISNNQCDSSLITSIIRGKCHYCEENLLVKTTIYM